MKNTFGTSVSLSVFGESHGPYVGAVLDGLAPGIEVNDESIKHALDLRRPYGKISTGRRETDEYLFASGVFNGKTTGTPITIIIQNSDTKSRDYNYGVARPGHADYTAFCKYHGFEDFRGGGHFSARVTTGIVALGAIARDALKNKNILIGTHIKTLGGICDRNFTDDPTEDIQALYNKTFPTLCDGAQEKMIKKIEQTAKECDSIGGKLETIITGMPAGVGEPFFDSVESKLSHMLFSVPAVKGVLFGAGEEFLNMTGSTANDAFYMKDGKVSTATNNNGGINGGITNGESIIFSCIMKPTPSIYKTQKSVNFTTGEDCDITIAGRHDPCIVHRARIVVDSLTAICLCDILSERFGTDFLA